MAWPLRPSKFYRCTIESILSGCITAWYGNCTTCITGGTLPALQDTYSTRCHRKAKNIIKDSNHPSHGLFTPLSSRR